MLNNPQTRTLQVPRINNLKRFNLPLFLTLIHIPLGLALYNSSFLAILHPAGVFFLGLYFAVRKNTKLESVALVSAYIIGSEVLWRMAQSLVFWEFGKYATALIMIVALIQRGYSNIPASTILYFVFLIPACLLTVVNNGFENSKALISSNMSGPLLIFASSWFFSYIKLTPTEIKRLLLIIAVPLVSVAVTTFFYTVTAEEIEFNTESNVVTSGGFGPNQVSTMLGLGAFVCLAYYLIYKCNLKETLYIGILFIVFSAQSVMTFSRSGIYNAVLAALIIVFFQMRRLGQGVKRLIPVLALGLVFLFLIFPQIDNFTGGKLSERFEDSGSTNRLEILQTDLQIFAENPILGVGVGEAKGWRKQILGYRAASHTEFARLFSEHGILGIFAIFALFFGIYHNFTIQKTSLGKSILGGTIVWSIFYMLNSGMRLAAPAFLLGFSFTLIILPNSKKIITPKKRMSVEIV